MLDFGVAEHVGRAGGAASRGLVGTTAYMAPEVLFGPGAPDARADLSALGVVAYECLTGASPYPSSCYDDLFGHMSASSRRSVRQTRPEPPDEIDEWMDRALQPDPFWRFASAGELARGLARALHASTSPRPRAPRAASLARARAARAPLACAA